jgi:hypothetical protein
MKKTLLSVSVFLIAISFAIAQTKMIAHRSHSGGDGSLTFNTDDNFGIPSSVDVFVIDTATQVKKWVHVSFYDNDSSRLALFGLRPLDEDTAYPRPDYTKIERVPKLMPASNMLIDSSVMIRPYTR